MILSVSSDAKSRWKIKGLKGGFSAWSYETLFIPSSWKRHASDIRSETTQKSRHELAVDNLKLSGG